MEVVQGGRSVASQGEVKAGKKIDGYMGKSIKGLDIEQLLLELRFGSELRQ